VVELVVFYQLLVMRGWLSAA